MDESYIDYLEGNPTAGIINMPDGYPAIDADLIIWLNEEGGEENVSTGWHAIEFLLWGQDLNDGGPGARPVEDYTTKGELAGEWVFVAYSERSQEDEHSCFSDNTVADIAGNAVGVRMALTGDYRLISGPGVST